ncbi:MAG: TMEM175 family protein [Microscillaceae bacterium]|jgi:uncharacterized membrane protein|nr:TMEM175 family protein [Microscillaceae bacterium]
MEIFNNKKETQRLEAFSDGVFSIIITLLALNLTVPENTAPDRLAQALLNQWVTYLSFVTSFFTILIMWINHHSIFKLIHQADNTFIYLNGLLLMFATAIPFATGLVDTYFNTAGANMALLVYSGLFVLVNLVFNALWYVVKNQEHISQSDISKKHLQHITNAYAIGFPGYLLAFGLAFWSPGLSLAICSLLWIFWAGLMFKVKF